MNTFDRFIDNKLFQNILIWIFVYMIALVSVQSDNVFLTAFGLVVFIIFPVYINNLLVLPIILSNKKVLGVFLSLLNVAVFTMIGVFFATNYFIDFEWRFVYNLFGILLIIVIFGSSLKLARDSFVRRQQEKEAQLQLLKAQLNPHFLFNTLNNLYGLSVVKSDALPELMLKLSDLLRYSLYDTREELVPLEKEIQYLENYISLENIRLEDKTKITFTKQGVFEGKRIAPMLLIVFVENAFKHLGKVANEEEYVAATLQLSENTLTFSCKNTVDPLAKKHVDMEKGKSGIGLQNAKKRMALLYPERHTLNIEKTKSTYAVQLTLQLV